MKYHCGLNNVRPCGKCSPRGALIAFISILFIKSSLLSYQAISLTKIDPKLDSYQTHSIPSVLCISLSKIRKQGGRWRKKLITPFPKGGRISETCLQSFTHLINTAYGGVNHTHGCSYPRCYSCSINPLAVARNRATHIGLHFGLLFPCDILSPTCMTNSAYLVTFTILVQVYYSGFGSPLQKTPKMSTIHIYSILKKKEHTETLHISVRSLAFHSFHLYVAFVKNHSQTHDQMERVTSRRLRQTPVSFTKKTMIVIGWKFFFPF